MGAISNVFSGPQGTAFIAALTAAVLVAAFHFFNPNPKPVPIWRVWANRGAIVLFIGLALWFGVY